MIIFLVDKKGNETPYSSLSIQPDRNSKYSKLDIEKFLQKIANKVQSRIVARLHQIVKIEIEEGSIHRIKYEPILHEWNISPEVKK